MKSPFDPSTFSAKIIDCHGNCGDDYYTCCFINCDFYMPGVDNIAIEEQDTSDNFSEKWPSFWSRFLHILTFGYFGSSLNGANTSLRSVKHSDRSYENFKMYSDFVQVCVDNCTSMFRKCYDKCICDENPDAYLCKPKMNYDSQNGENLYHFDWNKVS
jgi:hypothetical protein